MKLSDSENSGVSGRIFFESGKSIGGMSDDISMSTGQARYAAGVSIYMLVGASDTYDGGVIVMTAGTALRLMHIIQSIY